MASVTLTDVEKAQVRAYLGYQQLFQYKNPRLESAMNGLDVGAAALVREAMAKVVAVDDMLMADGLDSAGVQKVEEVTFFGKGGLGGSRIDEIRRVGRIQIARISKTLGVPVNQGSDYFSTQGHSADHWSAGTGGGGGGISSPVPVI